MNTTTSEHNEHGRPASDTTNEAHHPYWTRAHHDWRFWVALILMIAGIAVYIVSQDLSMGPSGQQHQPVPENTAP
ncbi:MAG: hypothetical protein Q8922_14340 [Bacteroidota bacterium]|nr:hypothetical protein [Bacteroidota bacterium]MDP4234338.1 hypothetical protein [Bacteroidota bacterium]MDP4243272.1 hypothetical protein [Bacteroidota bacterium]MDP4289097.1 hypothetical protein [Bacteroidota bacterium]